MKWSYNPPYLVKKIFSDFQWESENPKILITFDDGPNPKTTELILKELDNHSIKTIFFCVGENLEKYSSLAKEILMEGHDIGNHTFNHKKITKLSESKSYASIKKLQYLSASKLNYNIKYFRPPHGRFNFQTNKTLKQLDLINIMWSLLTYDYKNDLNIVRFALAKYLTANSIIVLHDSNKSKRIIVDSIKQIVEEVEKKKFKIGQPSECLRYYS